MWRRFVLVVIGTGLLICYFLQAAVAQPQVQAGKTHFGFSIGPGVLTSLPTDSSSGFYSGHVSAVPGVMVGGSFFVDVGQAGPFLVSTGLVVDYIGGTSLSWRGTCGGFPCEGSGRLNELNYIGEVKFTAPFLTPGTTYNYYIGAGGSTLWPSGQPTGPGGPSFIGSGTAPAVRVGFGFDRQVSENWAAGFKVGVQHAFRTEYDTTLPGEVFILKGKDEVIVGLTMTYTGGFWIPAPPPPPP